MKTKVVIENGETEIVLTPENEFEKDIVEKINSDKKSFNIYTTVDADYSYGIYIKHRIIINIKEIRP